MQDQLEIAPGHIPAVESLLRPHHPEMRKAFAFGKQWDSKICFSGKGEGVGIVGDETAQLFRDKKDLVVAHVRARCAPSQVLVVSVQALDSLSVIVIECDAEET